MLRKHFLQPCAKQIGFYSLESRDVIMYIVIYRDWVITLVKQQLFRRRLTIRRPRRPSVRDPRLSVNHRRAPWLQCQGREHNPPASGGRA